MKRWVSALTIFCLLFYLIPLQAASAAVGENAKPKVIPSLQEWTGGSGSFEMTASSRIVITTNTCSCKLPAVAEVFQEDLQEITGYDLPVVVAKSASKGDFLLMIDKEADETIGKEGYFFEVGDYVKIHANTETGVFYGTRTALQILEQDPEKSSIVKGVAKDFPKYGERGFMLDVGRKFFTIDYLKDYAKFMSYYKMNDFQLHLNDNEIFKDNSREHWNKYTAFRLESTKYPELTAKDGHYTKQDMRELQDIAGIRGLTITPEIDTPSHALSFTIVRPDLVKDNLPVDHLDITRQETVDFIKDVWDEYLDGQWFDAETFHFGADEFAPNDRSTFEDYRKFLNTMNEHFKSKGKKARMWGSLSAFPGSTPVDKDIAVNAWNNGWQDPVKSVQEGFKIINTVDGLLYIVPKAGYYYDYLNSEWLYNNWDPTNFGGNVRLQEGEPNLLGGMFGAWHDMMGKKVSEADAHDRIKQAMPVLAEKMWRGKSTDGTYAEFKQLAAKLGEGPGTNLLLEVESAGDVVVHYPFEEGTETTVDQSGNTYDGTKSNGVTYVDEGKTGKAVRFGSVSDHIETPLKVKGLPWTVSAWVKLDEQEADEMILMESAYGALKLKQKGTPYAGFSREGYDFNFKAAIPVGRWVHVAFKGDLSGTSLFIDGELKGTVSETTYLHTAVVGSKSNSFKGLLDEFKIFNRTLSGKEIAQEAGSPDWTINLAAHKTAVASSVEVPQFSANLVVDEITSGASRWSSKYTDNEWIYVDLGQSMDINKVVFTWENAYAKGYKVQVSDNAENWRDVFTTSAGVGGVEIIKFPTEKARYVRMLGTKRAGSYGYSMYEFEIYAPNPDDPVDVPEPVRYSANFENNSLDGWEHVIGKGVGKMELVEAPDQAGEHAVKFTSNSVNNLFVDQQSPIVGDGEIEFKITPQTDTIRSGVVFRYVNNDAWAYVGFDQGSWYWVNAQDTYGALTNAQGARLKKGETATVKVKFEGKHVTLTVNGTTYYEGAIAQLPTEAGKMGGRVFGPSVSVFDNFMYSNNVAEVPVTSIELDKAEISLNAGETEVLTASLKPGNATNKQVTWSSSDETVATVQVQNGKAVITALKAGTADITATTVSGGHKAVSKVTVVSDVPGETATRLTAPQTIPYGQNFDVRLGLQHVTESVYAQDITIDYDSSLMDFVSANSLVDGVGVLETKNSEGVVRLILASQGSGKEIKGDVDVVDITFKAKDLTEPQSGRIAVKSAVLGDSEGQETSALASSVQVEFTTTTNPEPSTDLNGDGKVSIGDLAIVAANYGKTSADAGWDKVKHADLNGDGKIDLMDLVLVAQDIVIN
ncbi:family 20 glycosylhydrolase [Paenibacillus sp. GCM10028914]|uniref:family 20 glycosylhydrolase n=1 Tax=Paenibacillus sp. GCM10028914 TaxID=3273416 RepID=UPI00360710FA